MTMPQNDIRFDRAMSVRELQRMLRVLAFDNLDVPLISVDGIFGQETADAVRTQATSANMNFFPTKPDC